MCESWGIIPYFTSNFVFLDPSRGMDDECLRQLNAALMQQPDDPAGMPKPAGAEPAYAAYGVPAAAEPGAEHAAAALAADASTAAYARAAAARALRLGDEAGALPCLSQIGTRPACTAPPAR